MAETRDSIVAALVEIVRSEFALNAAPGAIRPDTDLQALGMDSVYLIDIIGAIEERFGFDFDELDLEQASFKTIDSLASVIKKRLAEGS
jgi:acyl carrier protein